MYKNIVENYRSFFYINLVASFTGLAPSCLDDDRLIDP